MNFNSILIGSEDPQRLVDYYTKLFGEPTMSDGGYTGWQIGSRVHDRRRRTSEVNGKNAHPGRLIWNIETADVKGEFDAAEGGRRDRRRASRTASRATRTSWIATFADPDDNYFQLMTPMDPNQMGSGSTRR